jgi:hypothetical protein
VERVRGEGVARWADDHATLTSHLLPGYQLEVATLFAD